MQIRKSNSVCPGLTSQLPTNSYLHSDQLNCGSSIRCRQVAYCDEHTGVSHFAPDVGVPGQLGTRQVRATNRGNTVVRLSATSELFL
jgi:hypothetical protein